MADLNKAQQLAEDFSNFVNSYGHDTDAFIQAFSRQHRTLQQSMMRVMFKTIEHVASDEYLTDGRNESSQKVAKQIVNIHLIFVLNLKTKYYGNKDVEIRRSL